MNPTSFSPRPFAGEGPGVRGLSLNYAKLSKSPPLVQDRLMDSLQTWTSPLARRGRTGLEMNPYPRLANAASESASTVLSLRVPRTTFATLCQFYTQRGKS